MHFIAFEPSNIQFQLRVENSKADIDSQSSVRETNVRRLSEPCTRMVDGSHQDGVQDNLV